MPQKPVIVFTSLEDVPVEWINAYPKTPAEALEQKSGKYFDAKPCAKGHFSLKTQSKGKYKGCVTCSQLRQREKTKNQREANGVQDYSLDDFVRDAHETHKNKYDYSLITNFRNKTDEYWIVCPDCCCFKQKAYKHLAGQGCNVCNHASAMKERRITQEEYIQRCKEQHKESYGYESIKYTGMHELVTPTCLFPGHGIFETEANNFMRGRSGCQLCAALATSKRCRHTREKFIQKAKNKHGESTYDYSLVNYMTSQDKVQIICPISEHGVFEQTPSSHLRGSGCKKCAELKRAELYAMTMDDFLKCAREKHGDRYDYSKVILGELCGRKSRGHAEVEIICSEHGSFFQAPLVHFRSGCRKCHMEYLWNEVRAIGRDEWTKRCIEIHDAKYDYSLVHDFSKVLDEVVQIICPIKGHGKFSQSARVHLAGCGCQKCGDLNRGRDSFYTFRTDEQWAEIETELYLVEAFNQYYKFGISVDFEDRARKGYTEVYYRRELPRAVAWTAEQYLLITYAWATPGYLPEEIAAWGGATELRNKDFNPLEVAESIDELVYQIECIGWNQFYQDKLSNSAES
mgnify:CR=1 FL=1